MENMVGRIIACAFGLMFTVVSAQQASTQEPEAFVKEGLRKSDITRYVPSGTSRSVWFVYAANPDCSSQGTIEIRTTKEPEHGTVEAMPGDSFVSFENADYRSKCGGKKLRGINVNYKSSAGYKGSDQFELLALYPKGFAWEALFNINVR
jgi:hypothetical protein